MNLDTMFKMLTDAEKKAAALRQKLCAKILDAAKDTDLNVKTLQKVCGLSAATFHFRRKNLDFTDVEIKALIDVISAYDANIKQLTATKKTAKNSAKKPAKTTVKTDEPGTAGAITAPEPPEPAETDQTAAPEPDQERTPDGGKEPETEPGRATGSHHARQTL